MLRGLAEARRIPRYSGDLYHNYGTVDIGEHVLFHFRRRHKSRFISKIHTSLASNASSIRCDCSKAKHSLHRISVENMSTLNFALPLRPTPARLSGQGLPRPRPTQEPALNAVKGSALQQSNKTCQAPKAGPVQPSMWYDSFAQEVSVLRRFAFVQMDVFSAKPLEGNPLAVFTDGRGLSDAEMQAVAREMNLSETTFILPRNAAVEDRRGVRVRIFTPQQELPFAGHPTLGTAMVLRDLGRVRPAKGQQVGRSRSTGPARGTGAARAEEVLLHLNVGRIPVTFRQEDGKVFGEMRQRDPEFGTIHEAKTVARLSGLRAGDIASDLPIQTVSTGVAFAVVPVKSCQALGGLQLDWKAAANYLQAGSDAQLFYFVTRETKDPAARLHARMLFNNGEDPATGSAAGCAAAWMVRHGVAQPDERVLIEQGLEAKRPSRIFVRAGMKGNRITNVRVGGHAVEVLRGEIVL